MANTNPDCQKTSKFMLITVLEVGCQFANAKNRKPDNNVVCFPGRALHLHFATNKQLVKLYPVCPSEATCPMIEEEGISHVCAVPCMPSSR